VRLLSAASVSRRLAPLLAGAAAGSVLATFTRSAYVDLAGRILVLADAGLLNGPLNILLDPYAPAEPDIFADLTPGTPATLQDGLLHLGGPWAIDVARAPVWEPRLAPVRAAGGDTRVQVAVEAIASILDRDAPQESLARPQARPLRAETALTDLTHALSAGDRDDAAAFARRAAEGLAGLGPGLTPSGDDVLAGALLALALLAPADGGTIAEEILAGTRGRTTRISDAYLEAAAAGEAGEPWHRLAALLDAPPSAATSARAASAAGSPRDPDLAAAVREIMAFGETSGSDMLAGFVLATRALLDRPRGSE
jgi:hypothetical protein